MATPSTGVGRGKGPNAKFQPGNGGPEAVKAATAEKRRARLAAREAENPFPKAQGAKMRRVFTQDHHEDLTPEEKELRKYLRRDYDGYYRAMVRHEAEEAAPAKPAAGPAAPEKPPPDRRAADLRKLIDGLLDEIEARTEDSHAGAG